MTLADVILGTVGRAYYEEIGRGYSRTRRPDPRVAALVLNALGDAASVLNVGAGAGSYEPADRPVTAVEPSSVMLAQRPPSAAPAVQAAAEALPFRKDAFEATMAILTMHHWSDPMRGLTELRRVAAKRVVVLTINPGYVSTFWLTARYFPGIGAWDAAHFVPIERLRSVLGEKMALIPVPVPHDCADGFLAAFWRRPHAYLDPDVQAGISTFLLIGEEERREGLRLLLEELDSGEWRRRFGHLLERDELDLGYRLVVSEL